MTHVCSYPLFYDLDPSFDSRYVPSSSTYVDFHSQLPQVVSNLADRPLAVTHDERRGEALRAKYTDKVFHASHHRYGASGGPREVNSHEICRDRKIEWMSHPDKNRDPIDVHDVD